MFCFFIPQQELIRYNLYLRNDQTRLAVLSFSNETRVLLNYISKNNTQIPQCELFRAGGVWEQHVTFEESDGEKIGGMF